MASSEHHADDHGISHVASVKVLVGTGGTLLLLTLVTVAATRIDLGPSMNLALAMVIAVIKATLVVLFFMHLKYDKLFHSVVFMSAILAAALFVGFTLMDWPSSTPTSGTRIIPARACRSSPHNRLATRRSRGRTNRRSAGSIVGSVEDAGRGVARAGRGVRRRCVSADRPRSPAREQPEQGRPQVGIARPVRRHAAALALATSGTADVLAYALGGFKGGSIKIREALPPIFVGAGIGALAWKLFLPRTNHEAFRQPERLFLGAVAIGGAIATIIALNAFLTGLFTEAPWVDTAAGLAGALPAGAVAVLALSRLGQLSGWVQPPPRPIPPQYPPQGGGYPPQGGGYPPQGGGYPPQGGGYPPQGGGYPPPGGGYPPQGGGYPPQGGGGYPPPA
ncbi:MAG: cytochrome C oxidase subunit IV family protein [Kofleriaceae bacterium]